MKKYTANYTYTNPNFVIQNLVTNQTNAELLQTLYVVKNILQRGFPTTLSKYLQSQLGEIHKLDNFEERFLFATNQTPIWNDTIKGDKDNNYYPAKDFFERIIPNEFGDFSFIQSLLIPEIEINEITGEDDKNFINQQVDFYLPQAKLVIEIDGQQHKIDEVTRVSDNTRDNYLASKGITTIRITTRELQNGTYTEKVETILKYLERYDKLLDFYKNACRKIEENRMSEEEIKTKLLPTAIIRFQILLIELLTHKYLTFDEDWNFNILAHEDLPDFAELAIKDLIVWIDKLWQLKNKQELKKPNFNIAITNDKTKFQPITKAINIDFSLFKRYTDENKINEDVIFVRTDYFDIVKDKNYFRVSTTEPINYNITDEDKTILEFFLDNIFDKPSFREGQFPIISNALNRKDTIGLLPTGGGKSLCYQLPCLLQPSINFVVCPIKSLMYDQNDNLVKTLVTNVSFITSDLEKDERREIETNFEQGRYLFVWISPEKFQIPSFREKISVLVANFSIAYAVVDEVHCLSEWGHDFRTSYLNLAKTIDKLSPKDENGEDKIKFIGLTATASVNVLKDIKIEFSRQKQRLEDENIKSLLDYSRKELQFEVINDKGNKRQQLQNLIEELKNTENFIETTEKAGLVFTPNVNGAYGCYQVSNILNTLYQNKVSWFSGDIPKRDVYDEKTGKKIRTEPIMNRDEFNKYKQKVQKDFKENKYQLLVATKAFGMGIDKQNIFYTFHYGLPSSVEALYQEAGRAGRWDKRKKENKNKIGKCYVLHSPETHDQERVERLFHKDTTFSEMKAISDEVGFGGRDIFKQVFLFVQGQNDIEKDFEIILGIIKNYFKEKSKVRIFWNDAYSKLKIKSDVLQKAIYRLSLLGIISDWTTNFIDHFEVQFKSLNENHIIKSVSDYITKYEPNTDVKKDLQNVPQNSVLEKAVWYLLNWTFENIAYSRKQSLKTLSDWCSEFENSESFKRRIDSYFIFSETTFVLQHIAENQKDYERWFEVLTSNNQFPSKTEFEKLKDSISRFLESYRNSVGLNFVSGFVRLALGEYEDSDGKERFESTLSNVKETFTQEQQEDFLNRLKVLGKHLTEEQKMELSQSISRYYPEMLEGLAEYYDLAYLLNDVYAEKLKKMKTLNRKLYEQLAKI
ncbi:DEAD/DEAH box helicase [Riemerella anatipestifer]|uniref:DEAD/DEAH box helicase n=1 Tax=Riemerella anatipestifer TaxID=34085 RepID=UPI0023647257|nr:DEAD/DEAH box helicase [Riemerella anatipestifer]MDD1525626.1 DEAD/DEAH box helicase [Riemerella anatipestifer]